MTVKDGIVYHGDDDEDNDIESILESVLSQIADLNVKVVNLANKLDEHIKEPDCHNPAFMYKKKNK